MKTMPSLVYSLLVSAIMAVLGGGTAMAQNDSLGPNSKVLYDYYQKCRDYSHEEVSLKMADTLFTMAKKEGDTKMQALALITRVDYYSHNADLDNLIKEVNNTKKFSLGNGQIKYYYFAWTRLIDFYSRKRMLKEAMTEIEMFQKDALANKDGYAIMESYEKMGRIYHYYKDGEKALEYFNKALKAHEEYGQDKVSLYNIYSSLATEYIQLDMYPEAEETILAAHNIVSTNSLFKSYSLFFRLYDKWGKRDQAQAYLDSALMVASPAQKEDAIFQITVMRYYASNKEYASALEICKHLLSYQNFTSAISLLYSKANYLIHLGRTSEALDVYRELYELNDSTLRANFSKELSEQTARFDVNEIKSQKQELELKLRTRWLIFTAIALILFAVFLIIILPQYIKIKKLNEKLKQSEAVKSTFLQNLSHEIRTPLNSIMGFSQILHTQEELDHDSVYEYSGVILDNSETLIKLLSDTLELSGAKTAKNNTLFNINELCSKIIEDAKSKCTSGVELIFVPIPDNTYILSNEDGVKKVLSNLLDNSIKFTKKGSITVEAAYISKSKLQLSVTDTGPGISPGQSKAVFDPFYKIDQMKQGLGIGLSLCKVIADNMNATISIDKSYTGGCRMLFVIPV